MFTVLLIVFVVFGDGSYRDCSFSAMEFGDEANFKINKRFQ